MNIVFISLVDNGAVWYRVEFIKMLLILRRCVRVTLFTSQSISCDTFCVFLRHTGLSSRHFFCIFLSQRIVCDIFYVTEAGPIRIIQKSLQAASRSRHACIQLWSMLGCWMLQLGVVCSRDLMFFQCDDRWGLSCFISFGSRRLLPSSYYQLLGFVLSPGGDRLQSRDCLPPETWPRQQRKRRSSISMQQQRKTLLHNTYQTKKSGKAKKTTTQMW